MTLGVALLSACGSSSSSSSSSGGGGTPSTPFSTPDYAQQAGTTVTAGFEVSARTDGSPTQFLYSTVSGGATTTLSLPAVRSGAGMADVTLAVTGNASVILRAEDPSGSGDSIFGFVRGSGNSATVTRVTATRTVVSLTSGMVTVNFETKALQAGSTIAYFMRAEHAAFFYAFSGASVSEINAAIYGAQTPTAVIASMSAASVIANYTIPAGAANGQIADNRATAQQVFLTNPQAGALRADFADSLVTLNLTLDGVGWSDETEDMSGMVQINNLQMTIYDDGTFDNAQCDFSGNCPQAIMYAGVNFYHIYPGIIAGGAFFGDEAQEVAGHIYQSINSGSSEMVVQFIGAGAGARQ